MLFLKCYKFLKNDIFLIVAVTPVDHFPHSVSQRQKKNSSSWGITASSIPSIPGKARLA
jgi:hypothetical protein